MREKRVLMKIHKTTTLLSLIVKVLALTFYIIAAAFSQVTVAPSAVFVASKSGIGNLYITNNSTADQEVSISFVFGYPDADSLGNTVMNYKAASPADEYSLNPYIKSYPRTFILQAKKEQTVRLQVRTKGDAKDAFYFTRLKVTSLQKSPDIDKKTTEGVSAQVNFKFEQILPVFYHKGNVTTGLKVNNVSSSVKENKLLLLADLERTGTAPFLGSMKAVLYSEANKEIAKYEGTVAVYFTMKQKAEIDVANAAKGPYRLVLTYETQRSDIAVEDLVQAPPVTKEVIVNLQ
jgi:hypothetical protein